MNKKAIVAAALAVATTIVAAPAAAQEAESGPVTISGSATIASDYRFRGVSQTDKELAVQGGFSVSHESGFYVGTWGSNLSGWGTFGGSNTELDIYGGFAKEFGGVKVDVGLTWYMYPGGLDTTDFAEPYIKVSGTAGPVGLLAGVAYAPKQRALGRVYANADDFNNGIMTSPGDKEDNLYVWGDATFGVPSTPVTLKAHLGYSKGNSGLGPNGTSLSPTGEYLDWLIGADLAIGPVVLGVAYVDTNITRSEALYLQPNFASTKNGSSIAGSTAVFTLSASF